MQYLRPKFIVDVGKVNPEKCCEACAFGRGPHKMWLHYPDCRMCQEIKDGFGPRHDASPRCQSGGYPHCTCDTCF